jgi:hypothetical protein
MLAYQQLQDQVSKPSPVIWINVFNPSNPGNVKEVQAIVDTGAGITSLPESVIQNLGTNLIYTTFKVRSPMNELSYYERKKYRVCLSLDEILYEIEVMGIPRPYGIIGRDILNHYKIVLNAPLIRWGMNCSCPEGGCPLSMSE